MKILPIYATALAILLMISCQKKTDQHFEKLQKMNWLVGQWENKTTEGLLVETWSKDNDSTYSATSFFIKEEKDTIHFETILLTQVKDELIYKATVRGQNNDEPVAFKLTTDAENSFAFENPKHDYPKKIVYKKVNENALVATISGTQQGKVSTESYPMNKK